MAKLVVVSPALAGLSHELSGGWATIGRADGNTFQIVEASISGRHCEVRLQGDELVVRDLLSTNGTFIQGRKITEAVLKPGQTLQLGNVELRLEPSATPAAESKPARTKAPAVANVPAAAMTPFPVQKSVAPARAETDGDSTKKPHVLFVDDSMAFLETFSRLCSVFANNTWAIHSAMTADRALAILQENPIDLVVLDIGIPVVDGIQLLGIINQRYPGLKIAVMTGNATESNRAACLSNGAELFIAKPVSPDEIRVVFNMLTDLMAWAHRDGFSGALRQVGLQEVIQMECIGRHSLILEIRNRQLRGQIYIEVGAVTHAAVGTLVGEQAFFRLLSLKGGEFQLKPFKAPPQRTIQDRWEFLLMEAARVCDEETVLIRKKPVEDATKSSASGPAPAANTPVPKPAPSEASSPKGSPPATEGKSTGLSDGVTVVVTYDGKWKPVDGSKK
jgi:CheY-like chemotaxis protein